MKYVAVLCVLVFMSCKNNVIVDEAFNEKVVVEKINIDNVKLEIYDFNGLENFLNQEDDKVHVVNFWATWCKPCVKELPHFETLNEKYKDKGVEVLLVSLDFPRQYDKKLKPFIVKHNLKSKILVLDDVDMNTWIPKVDKDWDGAIPATLIYNKSKRQFYSKPFTYDELENELKQFLN
jgi:thiol-disulfide isomerase/thioredoxin